MAPVEHIVGATGNFQTISAALAAASNGDTIIVQAGTYDETILIQNISGLTIRSELGRENTTINGSDASPHLGTIQIGANANDLRIEGFTINGINGNGAVEKGAIYISAANDGLQVVDNEIVARGDSGFTQQFGLSFTNATIDGNIFSGKTFVGENPQSSATNTFSGQFDSGNDYPRQLVVIGNGGGTLAGAANAITFVNNQLTGTAGGISAQTGQPFGNSLATIDASNSTISGNTFSGVTGANTQPLRVRRDGTDIENNTFDLSDGGNFAFPNSVFRQNNSTGTDSGNLFIAADGSAVFPGTTGAESVTGTAMNDVFFATAGDDTLDGADGSDLLDLTAAGSSGAAVDLATGFVFGATTGIDYVTGIENVRGSAGRDLLNGNAQANTFVASGGADVIDGRGGVDTFDASAATAAMTVNMFTNSVTGAFTATVTNIEVVKTGGFADTIVTSGTADSTVMSGAGDDVVTVTAGRNVVVDAGEGLDRIVLNGAQDAFDITWDGTTATVTRKMGGEVVTLTAAGELVFDDGATETSVYLVKAGAAEFATIQSAVAVAGDGDTILVAAGTYVEQVVVDGINDLSIIATGDVTVKAPADVVQTVTLDTYAINSIITVTNAENVTLTGLTVDGDARAPTIDAPEDDFVGIAYRNASGGLTDVNITAIRDPYETGTTAEGNPVVSGLQRGVGLYVINDTQAAFFMHGGSITDFQKNATVIAGADLDIDGVTITGGGAQTIIAQNGFQVENSTGTITNSTISGIGYAGPDYYSGAMFLYGNTNLDVTNNTIIGTNGADAASKVVGIWVLDFGTPNSGGTITGNTISHVDAGIDVSGGLFPNSILIVDNIITDLDETDPYAAGVSFYPDTANVPHHVEGSDLGDYLEGGSAADMLTGLGGDDSLIGGDGADQLSGGEGDDQFSISDLGHHAGDVIDGGDGIDTVVFTGVDTLVLEASVTNVEVVSATSEAGAGIDASAVGNALAINGDVGNDNLTGTAFGDTIDGGEGDDALTGGAGNDLLVGGNGGDTAIMSEVLTIASFTVIADVDAATAGDQAGWSVVAGTEGTDMVSGVEAVQGGDSDGAGGVSGRFLLVGSGGFASIQAAVDAANDGDTIIVAEGSYAGQIIIDKDITLTGAGDATVLTGGAGLLDAGNFQGNRAAIIMVTGGANATIQNIQIDGEGRGSDIDVAGAEFHGIAFINAGGTVDDVTVTRIRSGLDGNGNVSGAQLGRAIFSNNADGFARSLTVSNSTITDFQKTGIDLRGTNLTVTVTGNDITGNGATPTTAQNGITIFGPSGSVTGNTVSEVGYIKTPDNSAASSSGILSFNSADVTISGNTLTGPINPVILSGVLSAAGVSSSNDLNEAVITGNTISGFTFGILSAGDGTAPDQTSNTFTNNTFNLSISTPDNPISVIGTDGADDLGGSTGADTLEGGAGADVLRGRGGDDVLLADTDDTLIDGGDNFDTVVFAAGTAVEDVLAMQAVFAATEVIRIGEPGESATFVVFAGMSIQSAIDAAGLGDQIILSAGNHVLPAQLSVNKSVTITGAGEAMTTLQTAATAWGLLVTADDVRIADLSVNAAAATTYGIKVEGDNSNDAASVTTGFNLENVTITGAGRSELDLNRVEGSTFTNITLDGNNTAGVGIGVTASSNLTFTDITTLGNQWGGIGLFPNTNVAAWTDGMDNITFTGELNLGEANGLYVQETGGVPATDIDLSGVTGATEAWLVKNPDHRSNGAEFTFVFTSEADAVAFALGLNTPAPGVTNTASTVSGPADLVLETTAHGARFVVENGMSIQAAINAASPGDTIVVAPGTYTENLTIAKSVTIIGPNEGLGGTDGARGPEAVIDGTVTVSALDAVMLDGLKFLNDTPTAGRSTQVVTLFFTTEGHTITNSVFESTVIGGANGINDLAIYTTALTSGSLTITDNYIHGGPSFSPGDQFTTAAWGRGIWSNVNGADLTITGNTIENARTAINQEGFSDATTDISGNTFLNSGSGISIGNPASGTFTGIANNDFDNVGTDFNLQNLTGNIVFDLAATGNAATGTGMTEAMVFLAGAGNDMVTGTAGADGLVGNGGADTLDGGAGTDALYGGAGNDLLFVDTTDVVIDGGADSDTAVFATGTALADVLANAAAMTGIEVIRIGETGTTTFVVLNGMSIQAAIDAASDGDTILVAPGNYTTSANYNPANNTNSGYNALGLLVNKSVTIAGIDATGAMITDADDVAATVTAAVESNWGTSFFVTAPDVTITGLTFIGAAPGDEANKVFEIVEDNFTLTHSVVGSVTGDVGSTIYINDDIATADPGFVSDIQSFTIANNILRGDFVLTNGAGFGHATTSLLLTNNAFVRNSGSTDAYNWGVIITGRDDAIVWRAQSVGPLVATGNSFALDYTTDRVLFVRDDDPARLPTAQFVMDFIADNAITTYAYAVDDAGVPSQVETSTTNAFVLALTAGNGSSWANPGDTLIVQTDGSPATEMLVTDDLSIDLRSSGLTLELGTGVADLTLLGAEDADVTGNADANTITGNDGANSLQGAGGADNLSGGAGMDSLDGGEGADTLDGGAGADQIMGGDGDDLMQVDTADTQIDGGAGADTAIFAAGTELAEVQAMQSIFAGTEIIRIGEPGSGATFVVFAGMSIQTAIDAAGMGDTIIIGSGTFAETVTITKQLALIGTGDMTVITGGVDIAAGGTDSDNRVVLQDVKVTNASGDAIDIGAHDFLTLSGILVEGLTGFSSAIDINFVGAAEDIRITGSTFSLAGGQIGLRVSDQAEVTNLHVADSTFTGGQYGFYFANDTAGSGDTVTGTFSGLTFTGQTNLSGDGFRGFGIYAEKLSDAALSDITVIATGAGSNQTIRGISLNLKNGAFADISLTDIALSGFDQAQTLAAFNPLLSVGVKPGASLDGLVLDGITGAKGAGFTGNGQIVVDIFHEAFPAQIADVTLTNSTLTGLVKVQTSDYTAITGNTITGDLQLVLVDQPAAPGNDLSSNAVSGSISFSDGRDTTLPEGADDLALFNGTAIGGANNNQTGTGNDGDNVITGNDGNNLLSGGLGADTLTGGAGADTLDGGDGADDLEGGMGDDQIIADASDTVEGGDGTDTMVLAMGTMAGEILAAAGQFTGLEIIRTGEETGPETFVVLDGMSIQTAINAAKAGDTIIIGAGDFTGNLTVDKSLNILGANAGIAGDDARGAESTLTGNITIAADGITIDGLHFDGGASAIRGQSGALAYDDLTIRNNLIENTTDSAIRLGLGSGGGLGSENWVITDNKISAITGNALTGMVLFNVTGLTLTGNVIDHDLATSTGRRGINLDGVRDATVTANTVDMGLTGPVDSTASTASPWAIQISMSDQSVENLDLSSNAVSGAFRGIVGLSQRDMTGVTVAFNTLADVVEGIVFNAGSTPPVAPGVTMGVSVTNNLVTAVTHAILVRDLHGGHPNGPVSFADLDVTGNFVLAGNVQIGRAETFMAPGATGPGNGLLDVTGTGQIDGTAVADVVQVEGSGAISFSGGLGADTFVPGAGGGSFDGGDGIDTLDLSKLAAGATVDLAAGTAGNLTLSGVEHVVGTGFADVLTGDALANVLEGGAGDDTLSGGMGDDTLDGGADHDTADYSATTGPVFVNLVLGVAFGAEIGNDQLIRIEAATGGAGNDVLVAGAIGAALDGGAGHDNLTGGSGNDTLTGGAGNDTLSGGTGTDTAIFDGDLNLYDIIRTGGTYTLTRAGTVDSVTGVEIFSFNGTLFDVTGNADLIVGSDPAILGIAEAAPDEDNDPATLTVDENSAAGTVVAVITTSDVNIAIGDSLDFALLDSLGDPMTAPLEIVKTGDATAEIRLAGNLDFETTQSSFAVQVQVTDSQGRVALQSATINVSDVNEAPTDILFGDVTAGLPDDTDGAIVTTVAVTDPDTGDMDFTFATDNGKFEVVEFPGGSGTFVLKLKDGETVASEEASALTIAVTATDAGGLSVTRDVTFAVTNSNLPPGGGLGLAVWTPGPIQAGTRRAVLTPEPVVVDPEGDTLTYTLQSLSGGRFFLGANAVAIGQSLTEAELQALTYLAPPQAGDHTASFEVSDGSNTVALNVALTVTPGINESLSGTANDDVLDGAAGNDVIRGLAGDDMIFGGAGNDTVVGGTGADTLNGGGGRDTLDYRTVSVAMRIDLEAGTGHGGDAEGDVITGFEDVTGGSGNDTLIGDANDNILTGGRGADVMEGRAGNDNYRVDDVNDVVIEIADGGIDRVQSSVSYSLNSPEAEFVEELILTGSAAINATGSTQSNVLRGNSAANILNGGLGNDTMTGAAGADTFIFDTTPGVGNIDQITDFAVGVDQIGLDGAVFAGLTAGPLDAAAFAANAGGLAMEAQHRVIYNTNTGALWYDADGADAGAAVQIAVLTNLAALTQDDVFIF